MSDIVLVGIFSASGAIGVALASALAGIFGPGHAAARERRATAKLRREDGRYQRVQDFLDALLAVDREDNATERNAVQQRHRLVATVRRGEGAVAEFSSWLVGRVVSSPNAQTTTRYVDGGADRLYGWLRGELHPKTLEPFEVSTSVVIEVDSNPEVVIVERGRLPRSD